MISGKSCEEYRFNDDQVCVSGRMFFCYKAAFQWELCCSPLYPAEQVDFLFLLILNSWDFCSSLSVCCYEDAINYLMISHVLSVRKQHTESSTVQIKLCCTQKDQLVFLEQNAQELSICQNVFSVCEI